jgi:hypothetical protein
MSTARVTKDWRSKGLASFTTEEILGSLNHFGVTIDEAGFGQLATALYPLGIARAWEATWNPANQFVLFHVHAAAELWARWQPDRLSTWDFAKALSEFIAQVETLTSGTPSAALESALARVEELLPRVPREGAGGVPAFIDEVGDHLDYRPWLPGNKRSMDQVDSLARMLWTLVDARAVQLAERFVPIEETFWPVRTGIGRTIIQGARGDHDGAVENLRRMAVSSDSHSAKRIAALDTLLDIEEVGVALNVADALQRVATDTQDEWLTREVNDRLIHLHESILEGLFPLPEGVTEAQLEERLSALRMLA